MYLTKKVQEKFNMILRLMINIATNIKVNMNKKQLINNLKDNWRKPKQDNFDFRFIESYYRKKDDTNCFQTISDETINDMDLHEVFKYLDRTNSRVGQQYFFNKLLTINKNQDFSEQEQLIFFFKHNEKVRLETQIILSKLNTDESYYIPSLFMDEYIDKPKWYWTIKLSLFITIASLILTFIYPVFFILLMIMLVANFLFHYWNKRNIYMYIHSIPQLLILYKATDRLLKNKIPVNLNDSVIKSLKSIKNIKRQLSVFTFGSKNNSEIEALIFTVLEYIKILFLIEPLVVFNTLSKLKNKSEHIRNLYEYVGKIDSAISILSLREGVHYYCNPSMITDLGNINIADVFHPLISNCIPNSIKINGKSILLTGSNMSGKTTFIRTIAINALCAQTINTCFAEKFCIPQTQIFSSIRIADDLINDKSYYFEEVLAIKNIIEKSKSDNYKLFFLDEIFKGTNTIERIAAGKAVLSHIGKNKSIVFVSTHDIELTDLLKDKYELYHFTEEVKNEQIYFDYKLKQGRIRTRNAIRILELNNYPDELIKEAKEAVIKIDRDHYNFT